MAGVTSIHSSNTGNGIFWVWGIFSPHGTVKGIKNIKVQEPNCITVICVTVSVPLVSVDCESVYIQATVTAMLIT